MKLKTRNTGMTYSLVLTLMCIIVAFRGYVKSTLL